MADAADVAGFTDGVAVLEVPAGELGPVLANVLGVLQAWRQAPERARLVVVTKGAAPLGPVDPVATAVWGMVRAAAAEQPGRVVLADVEAEAEVDRAVAMAVASERPQVAVRGGELFAPSLERAGEPAESRPVSLVNGTVLVTGGTGSLGALVRATWCASGVCGTWCWRAGAGSRPTVPPSSSPSWRNSARGRAWWRATSRTARPWPSWSAAMSSPRSCTRRVCSTTACSKR